MKSMLIFSLMLISAGAFAVESQEKAEWFRCDKDEDCVDISYLCAGATVNKAFAREANELYRAQNAARDCAISPNVKNLPPFRVFCKDHKCGSQGRNPKMGFS